MQLLLMGVAGCTAIDIVVILKKKRVALTGFEVAVKIREKRQPEQNA